MSEQVGLLRSTWRRLSRLRSRVRRTLQTELSYHRLEQRWADLRFWRQKAALQRDFSVVFKAKATSDHFLPSILSYLKTQYRDVSYVSFSRDERPREDPASEAAKIKLYRFVEKNHPEVLLAYDSPLSPQEIHYLADQGIQIGSTTAGLDSFFIGGASSQASAIEALRRYAWYFVGHRPHVEKLQCLGIKAQHMLWGYEPRWFKPLENVEKKYDVLFTGDIYYPMNASRQEMIARVAEHFQVALLSYRPPHVGGVVHLGTETNPHRLNRILNQARIVLGSDRVSNHDQLNVIPEQTIFYEDDFLIRGRTYLTIGSGACYMVERHPEIARQFDDRREVVLWDDYDELCDQIDYYLKHDDERRAVGRAGHRRALTDYNVSTCIEKSLSIMGVKSG
jgi:hypothetical protein